jgi:hypothetical protein
MSHLWRFELDDAEADLRRALAKAEQTGHVEHHVLALTYLALTLRCKRDVEATRHVAQRALERAQGAGMPMYVGHAHANLGWAAWRERKHEEAETRARIAVEHWGDVPNPGRWFALLPLAAILVARNDVDEACRCLSSLLGPPNMRLPDPLEQAIASALRAHGAAEPQDVRALLKNVIETAVEVRLL